MVSENTIAFLKAWACTNKRIKRLWIFGSRVKGRNRDDSDLDLAIEIHKPDKTDCIGYFLENQYPWMSELSGIAGFCVHVIPWNLGDIISDAPPDSILLYDST